MVLNFLSDQQCTFSSHNGSGWSGWWLL